MLLVALATGSCSMFTSCKDTDDDFYSRVISNEAQLEKDLAQAKEDIANLKANFDNYYTKQEVDGKVTGLQEQIDELNNVTIPDLQEQINGKASQEDLEKLQKEVAVIQKKIQVYNDLYNKYFKAFDDRLNQLITDITLQQTWNPMFGSINLPVGLSSTAATNYYGESDKEFTFPSSDPAREAIIDANGESASLAAIRGLNFKTTFSVPNGIYMNENNAGKGSLGFLYLGINPTDINPDNVRFSLISSDNETKFENLELKSSDKKLMFGVSRAASENGFYETELTIDPTKANEYSIRIQGGLTNAMKDAIKGHTKSDFATLAKVVYDQMQNVTPAYALKAEWDTPNTTIDPTWAPEFDEDGNLTNSLPEDQTKTVTYVGKYEIAAATVKPLGFWFLQDIGASSDKLPTIGSLEEAINKVFKDININISDENIKVEGENINITLPDGQVITLTYNADGTVDGNDGALNGFVDSVNKALKDAIAQINGSVQESIDNIKNNLVGKASKFDGLVSKYNSLANRINNLLKNPNHYLQVMMAYQGQDGQLHQMSANEDFPTVFTKGTGAYQLYLTSYTAEIIAPSCKKYVAITEGAAKDAINGTADFNTVLPGNQQAVTLDASQLKPGKYEVVYQALDYQGRTSTRTFYFTVVD